MSAEWRTPNCDLKAKEQTWTKIEDSGWKPRELDVKKEITFFNNPRTFKKQPEYDLFHSYTKVYPLWNIKKIRDNRSYLPDIHKNIFEQEWSKPVSAPTSFDYGRPWRVPMNVAEDKFGKQRATGDFYRRQGVMKVIEKKVP